MPKRLGGRFDRDRSLVSDARARILSTTTAFFTAAAQSIATKLRGAAHKAAASDDKDHVNGAAAEIDYDPLRVEIESELKAIAQDGGKLGLEQVGADIDAMLDQVNERAVKWAEEHSGELVKGLDETTRDLVRTLVSEAVDKGWSNDELADELEGSEAFSEARSDRIARTETAFADCTGNLIGWQESGVVDNKEWITSHNGSECEICLGMDGEVVGLDAAFSDGSDCPPAHPHCECDFLPVVKETAADDDE